MKQEINGVGKFSEGCFLIAFTATTSSVLAIGFYFVFRGVFFNISDNASSISLNSLMTISVLTGLFTDTATLKLKEVFEVLFKPKDLRTGKREDE